MPGNEITHVCENRLKVKITHVCENKIEGVIKCHLYITKQRKSIIPLRTK